jgi:hypothetical protein
MIISKRSKYIGFIMLASVAMTSGCKTSGQSSSKDVGLSPKDLKAPSMVLWEDGDYVHFGHCPVGSASINRQCQGVTEAYFAMKAQVYSDSISAALIATRPAGTPLPAAAQIDQQKEKSARLQAKINSGTLPAETVTGFQKTISDIDGNIKKLELALTPDETKIFDIIVTNGLKAGKDVTFEEEQILFDKASAPFTGQGSTAVAANCPTGAKAVGAACWFLGGVGESCDDVCTKVTKVALIGDNKDFAGSGGTDQHCAEIGTAFGGSALGPFARRVSVGLGCANNGRTNYYRASQPDTTNDAKDPNWARYCACK